MKIIIKKPILVFTLILSLGIGLIGCSSKPKGQPEEILNSYFENIKNNNFDNAYELLSQENKTNFQKEEFCKLLSLQMQTNQLKETKVKKTNEYETKDINGITYKNVVEFDAIQTMYDIYDGKDTNGEYKRYVVNDNGNWRVCDERTDIKKSIAEQMTALARMYYSGKGQKQDLNQAASILNDAIKISPDYTGSYYLLGIALAQLQRYDESISNIENYLSKVDNDEEKSDAYTVLGSDYGSKRDYTKAKDYYKQAIQLNDNNQYAKTNLEMINKIN